MLRIAGIPRGSTLEIQILSAVKSIFQILPVAILASGSALATVQPYDHGDPTPQEQMMLELVNRARADPAAEASRLGIGLNDGLDPDTISNAPKQPLVFHPKLIVAARAHNQWMLDNDTFSHTGANGSQPGQRMAAAGYDFSGNSANGENIALGASTFTQDFNEETIARHNDLFLSPPHRKNICLALFEEIGLGVRVGEFNGAYAVAATQNFAQSDSWPGPFITGVVFNDDNGDGFYNPGEGVSGVTVFPQGGSWNTVTSTSGGYAVPYSGLTGTVTVSFSGGPLQAAQDRVVNLGGKNMKLDLMFSPTVEKFPKIAIFQPRNTDISDGKPRRKFGRVVAKSDRSRKYFTIRNLGESDLTISPIITRGPNRKDFRVFGPQSKILQPGQSSKFKVVFKPSKRGWRNAYIQVLSNDAARGPYTIKLVGTGVRSKLLNPFKPQ